MTMPFNLLFSIETLLEHISSKKIQKAANMLSLRYREKQNKQIKFIQNEDEALAYLCMRLPATFAACSNVFSKVKELIKEEEIKSLLDLGSGSGAALWAAIHAFPSIKTATLIEDDPYLIELGKNIGSYENTKVESSWKREDFTKPSKYPMSDLVVFSYSLGEVPKNSYAEVFSSILPSVGKLLVIIEPGTPVGFERILHIRDHLLAEGLHLLAPCPHALKCPLNKTFKWCHFSQRLPRTTLHKYLKEGSLGYEDEKFSYVVFSKKEFTKDFDRIIGHPKATSGFIELDLCTKSGEAITKKILKKETEGFTALKRLDWGDKI